MAKDRSGCLPSLGALVWKFFLDVVMLARPRTGDLVGPERRVLLLAKNYIYVDPAWSAGQRRSRVAALGGLIPDLFDKTNQLFATTGLNVHVVSWRTEVVPNAAMLTADIDGNGARGATGQYAGQIAKQDSKHIHVHWCERSTTAIEAVGSSPCGGQGDCNYVILTNERSSTRTLAHELGHYFAHSWHSTDPSSLMNGSPGDQLSDAERKVMWDGINKYRTHLRAASFAVP